MGPGWYGLDPEQRAQASILWFLLANGTDSECQKLPIQVIGNLSLEPSLRDLSQKMVTAKTSRKVGAHVVSLAVSHALVECA